jgi:hypothetical protein
MSFSLEKTSKSHPPPPKSFLHKKVVEAQLQRTKPQTTTPPFQYVFKKVVEAQLQRVRFVTDK